MQGLLSGREDVLLTTRETAELLRVKEATLEQWRWQGRGPLFVKVGRLVRYRLDHLRAYADVNSFRSTTEAGGDVWGRGR